MAHLPGAEEKKDPVMTAVMASLYICLIVIGEFFMLHAAKVYEAGVEVTSGSIMESILDDPFGIIPPSRMGNMVLLCTLSAIAIGALFLWSKKLNDKGVMMQDQKGGATLTTDYGSYNKKYSDPPGKPIVSKSSVEKGTISPNLIMSHNVVLSMDTRLTRRNNNILVIGGSGTGKSRFFIKPNILQLNTSFVVTDPAGELLRSCGKILMENDYKVKVFNLVDMHKSDCYNPFHYIRDELGVKTLVNCLIQNTTPPGKGGGDPFWEKSEVAILSAIIGYLRLYCPKKLQNFTSVMHLLHLAEVDESDPNAQSGLDLLFDEVARNDPQSIALKSYKTFKLGGAKTLKSILISAAVRLDVFNFKDVTNLTRRDTIDLGMVGDEKTALFIIIPTANTTFNFLAAMMYSQLFETLYYHAENETKDGRLPVHVRFLLDEFANIGQIPEFNEKLATIRKYEISCVVVLQSLSQIKKMYEKDYEALIGNCDSLVFLGSAEMETAKYISEKLGKTTIKTRSHSKSKSGDSESTNLDQRDIMTPDEISNGKLKNEDCFVFIRNIPPFHDAKYKYETHPNYKFTFDGNDSYAYENTRNNEEHIDITELERNRKEAAQRKREENRGKMRVLSDKDYIAARNIRSIDQLGNRLVPDGPQPMTGSYGEGYSPTRMDDAPTRMDDAPAASTGDGKEGKGAGGQGEDAAGKQARPKGMDKKPKERPQLPGLKGTIGNLASMSDQRKAAKKPPAEGLEGPSSGKMSEQKKYKYIDILSEDLKEEHSMEPVRIYTDRIPHDKMKDAVLECMEAWDMACLLMTDSPDGGWDGYLISKLYTHVSDDLKKAIKRAGSTMEQDDNGGYELYQVHIPPRRLEQVFGYKSSRKNIMMVEEDEDDEGVA